MKTRKPFPNSQESSAFLQCFMRDVSGRLKIEQAKFISESNIQAFSHGINWQSHNSSSPDEVSTLKSFSHEMIVEKSGLIEYNLGLLDETAKNLTEAMAKEFMKEMYATMSESCDKVGNTVSGMGKSTAESFVEMLEKIEFGVDRDGNPVMPCIHVNSAGFEAFKNDPAFNDQEFKTKIDEITERKKAQALEREKERRSRFKVGDE
jgi:hypothetical protein